jgi:hypothetical protein
MNGGAAGGCVTVPAFTVGEFGDPTTMSPSRPVKDGAQEGGKTVKVECRVVPSAGGFDVEVNVSTVGDTTLSLRATVDSQARSNAGKMTLKKTDTWSSATCKLETLTPSQGVAAGRFWTHVTCMGAVSETAAMCDIFGEVRVENCAQQ